MINEQELDPKIKIEVQHPDFKDFADFTTAYNPQGFDLYQASFQQRSVPTQDSLLQSRSIDRTQRDPGKGLWQIAVRAERDQLIKGINDYANEINTKLKTMKSDLTAENILTLVKFLPNFNFPYYNKLVKQALAGLARDKKTTSIADYQHIQGMNVLNLEAERYFLTLLAVTQDTAMQGFSVLPPASKSGIPIKYKDNKPYIPLANPGDVFLRQDDNKKEEIIKYDLTPSKEFDAIIMQLSDKMEQINDEMRATNDLMPLYSNMFMEPNSALTKSLLFIRSRLMDSHVKYDDLLKVSDALNKFLGFKRSKYLLSLARPFTHQNGRVPTLLTPPSATFSIRSVIPLTTNALGNVAFVFQPFYLGGVGSGYSGLGINNNVALTGTAASNFFLATAYGNTLPANFYTRYRIVSSGLRVYCYPSSNNDNGLLSISVSYDAVSPTIPPAAIPDAAQFGDFALTENGYFKQTTTISSRTVQEHTFLPPDESFWDYMPLGTAGGGVVKTGFLWSGYITGAAPSTSIARLEVVVNFEALVDNEYTDYMPSDSPTEEIDPKIIFSTVNRIKLDGDPITPKKVEDVLADINASPTPDNEIVLPKPSTDVSKLKQQMDENADMLRKLLKDKIVPLPDKEKTSWFSNIIDKVKPIALNLIKNLIGRYIPFF